MAEVSFQADSREDEIAHSKYNSSCVERSDRARKGGGLLLLNCLSVRAVQYLSSTRDIYEEVETGRVWTFISGDMVKVAIHFVYI